MLLTSGSLGGARYAVTDRWGGVSGAPYAELNLAGHVGDDPDAVAGNRRALLDALPGARRLALMSQVHGTAVSVVDGDDTTAVPEADILVTAEAGTALVVLTADCVPVLLAGGDPPVVAAVHAGRRGVEGGAVEAAVQALVARGPRAQDLRALIGPAVCGGCYEVPADLRAAVAARVPEAYASTRPGTPALDLPAAVAAVLRRLGVLDIEDFGICTVESPDLFSHRREGVTGRIAGVVWVPVEDVPTDE